MKKTFAKATPKRVMWRVSTITVAICLLLNVNAIAQAPPPTDTYVANVLDYGAVGNCTLVNNAWTGTDNTAAIQAAIDDVSQNHPGGTVLVPDGTYLVTRPAGNEVLELKSNITFKMTGGATIQLKENNAWGYFILSVANATNVNIVGGKVQGERHQHLALGDFLNGVGGEWGMGLFLSASSHIYVDGVSFTECWGDGIDIGGSAGANTDVTIFGVVCDDNRRQGMSIVFADGVLVQNSSFNNTRGTAPQSGIDIEPDAGKYVRNVQVLNNQFINNRGNGLHMYSSPSAENLTKNITVTGNIVVGGQNNIYVGIHSTLRSEITVSNNTLSDPVAGSGIFISGSSGGTYNNNVISSSDYLAGPVYAGITFNVATGNTANGNCISNFEDQIKDNYSGANTFSFGCNGANVFADPSSLDFGTVALDSISPEQSYTLTGNDLLDDVIVTAGSGYEISITSGSGFTTELRLSPSSGNIDKTIYVRFKPTAARNYKRSISNLGAGYVRKNVAVTGTGTFPTGIDATTKNENVIVSPNPFHSSFKVQISPGLPLKNLVLKIYNLNGKEVKTDLINQSETIISRKGMENGIYFYSIFNDNNKIADGKLIVQ